MSSPCGAVVKCHRNVPSGNVSNAVGVMPLFLSASNVALTSRTRSVGRRLLLGFDAIPVISPPLDRLCHVASHHRQPIAKREASRAAAQTPTMVCSMRIWWMVGGVSIMGEMRNMGRVLRSTVRETASCEAETGADEGQAAMRSALR